MKNYEFLSNLSRFQPNLGRDFFKLLRRPLGGDWEPPMPYFSRRAPRWCYFTPLVGGRTAGDALKAMQAWWIPHLLTSRAVFKNFGAREKIKIGLLILCKPYSLRTNVSKAKKHIYSHLII